MMINNKMDLSEINMQRVLTENYKNSSSLFSHATVGLFIGPTQGFVSTYPSFRNRCGIVNNNGEWKMVNSIFLIVKNDSENEISHDNADHLP